AVGERIAGLVDAGVLPGDIVILLGAMSGAQHFADALEARELPCYLAAGEDFHATREIVEIRDLIAAIALPRNDKALAAVLAGRLVGLSNDALWALRHAAGPKRSLWDALSEVGAERSGLLGDEADACAARLAHERIERLRRDVGMVGLGDLVHEACELFDFDLTLFAEGSGGRRAWANVQKLIRLAEVYERKETSDPDGFLRYLDSRGAHLGREAQAATATSRGDAVRIMTIHSAKGLEFPVVFVADLGAAVEHPPLRVVVGRVRGEDTVEAGFRVSGGGVSAVHRRIASRDASLSIAEKKRLLYVACTRAESLLVLSGAADLTKPPKEKTPLGWLRAAIGEFGDGGIVRVGEACASVRVVHVEQEEVSAPRDASARRAAPDTTRTSVARADTSPEPVRTLSEDAPRIPPPAVSYSGLRLLEECPYRYYLTRVLRLGAPPRAKGREALSLGSAVHAALQVGGDATVDRPALEQLARRFGLD
ncbi:MAG: 3'-5' exonuclease, partial [Actinomycetota bacterium]|nr:3'-5' exonuclease [Actinomycetota bacterium]